MRIGYPCINRRLECRGNRTFRLASYSPERLVETVGGNLDCLLRVLEFNVRHRIFFFRITSDLVPFASHPVNTYDWPGRFRQAFEVIGKFIRENGIRINMHPDQFILINSPGEDVFARSKAELEYHCLVLDLLGLDTTAKIQIHVGGVYGDKQAGMERFARRFRSLGEGLRSRLVVENDHVSYSAEDCLEINRLCGIPVVLDTFHLEVLPGRYSGPRKALTDTAATWGGRDGIPFIDYSLQAKGAGRGTHAASINIESFKRFLSETGGMDFDIMLEIKDKEASALRAVEAAGDDPRFFSPPA